MLGIGEAGYYAGMIYYLSFWYVWDFRTQYTLTHYDTGTSGKFTQALIRFSHLQSLKIGACHAYKVCSGGKSDSALKS